MLKVYVSKQSNYPVSSPELKKKLKGFFKKKGIVSDADVSVSLIGEKKMIDIARWAQSLIGFYVDRWYDTEAGKWMLESGPIRLASYHADLLTHLVDVLFVLPMRKFLVHLHPVEPDFPVAKRIQIVNRPQQC